LKNAQGPENTLQLVLKTKQTISFAFQKKCPISIASLLSFANCLLINKIYGTKCSHILICWMNKKFSSFVLEGRISIETRELAASQHICKYIIRIEKKGLK